MSKHEVLREVRRVTQWKDGCIFKTVSVKHVWIDMDSQTEGEFIEDGTVYIYCNPSTSYTMALSKQGISSPRRKS